ncbi:hypothetical protein GGR54DRAFT_82518 [Hypoxylon sp. NC1633]|nr:hypothetical protein GGR54DRAFT_82518 [Hypoxylon sp. NC1633]
MADPLSVLGGVAAGLQLVSMAAKGLLATIKLIKDLGDMPGPLVSLLNEVDDSISRLCSTCALGTKLYDSLDPAQVDRLTRCVRTLHQALEDIHTMLAPLIVTKQGRTAPLRQLWKSLVYLKMENEFQEKLRKLNRLNVEVIREFGVIGLETHITTNGLIIANNVDSKQGFTSIEAKMDSLQDDFRKFTFSVQQAHQVSSESPSSFGDDFKKDASSWRRPSDSSTCTSSSTSSEATLCAPEPPEEARITQERAAQMLRYLKGNSAGGSTSPRLRVLSSGDLPGASLDHILYGIRTFYTIGNFDASSAVVRPKFWADTDTAIYLMKISQGQVRGASQSQKRAFRILKSSTADISNTLRQGTALILIELLSTLSPVNTTTCSYVREGMLRYLWELSREQLPRNHPIALVIDRLKNDQGDKDVTLRALTFVVERLRATLGPLHELSQLALYRLCSLLRRGGDYVEALRVAGEGIRAIRALQGPGSLQERWLSRHLEHVYMDQCDWVSALSVCFDIVGQQQLDNPNPDPLYHDECAVMTMEDIAKTCECAGNVDQAIAWLKQASISGSMVWSQGDELAHIHDKLRELLKQTGNEYDLEHWTESINV